MVFYVYTDIMTYLVSISSRNLVYFPEVILKKMKIKSPGKIELIEDNGRFVIKPVKDMMEFAGMGKDKAKHKYWKNFREKMETNYEEVC